MCKYKIGDEIIYKDGVVTLRGKIKDVSFSAKTVLVNNGIFVEVVRFENIVGHSKVNNNTVKKEENKMMNVKDILSSMNLDIVDYKVFNNKVVVVYFSDGSDERSVCDEADTYDFERAIEVCMMKKILGGSGIYNNIVRTAMRQIDAINKQRKAEKEAQERMAKKKEKDIQRKIKRREKKRQEQVDIQTEAFFNAMIKYDDYVAAEMLTESETH